MRIVLPSFCVPCSCHQRRSLATLFAVGILCRRFRPFQKRSRFEPQAASRLGETRIKRFVDLLVPGVIPCVALNS